MALSALSLACSHLLRPWDMSCDTGLILAAYSYMYLVLPTLPTEPVDSSFYRSVPFTSWSDGRERSLLK